MSQGASSCETCDVILSWAIDHGYHADADLSGLSVRRAGRYRDDEDRSHWKVMIYIHERPSDAQLEAPSAIFRGEAAGNTLFTGTIATVIGVRRARIDLDHRAGREAVCVGALGRVHADRAVDFDGTVSCGIPGQDHPGRASVSGLSPDDGPFRWTCQERCGFSTDFAYAP